MKIDDEHVLPCDFIVGHVRFTKGIRLETVRKAAERWFTIAASTFPELDGEKLIELKKKFDQIDIGDQ